MENNLNLRVLGVIIYQYEICSWKGHLMGKRQETFKIINAYDRDSPSEFKLSNKVICPLVPKHLREEHLWTATAIFNSRES